MTGGGARDDVADPADAHDASVPSSGRAAQLERLATMSRAVTYATSLDDVLRMATEHATALLAAERAVLLLADESGQLHVRASTGVSPDRLVRFGAAVDESLAERLQGLVDIQRDADGFIAVPLVVRGQVIGLLAVRRAASGRCPDEDEWLLSALADQVAAPIELARLDDELRRGLRMAKEKALATLAHDLRSPLQAIEGFAALVEQEIMGPVTAEQRNALQRIRMSGRHMLSLQEDMLDLSRSSVPAGEAVDGERSLAPTDPYDVIHEAVAIVRADVEGRDLSLLVESPDAAAGESAAGDAERAPLRLLADSDRLRRVLINLLANAAKYTARGGRISICAAAVPDDRDSGEPGWGAVTVTDTGVGIAAEHTEAIFQPYFRVSGAVAAAPGVGLGLAICRELVEQMGGTITVESAPGTGSSFAVRLRRAD